MSPYADDALEDPLGLRSNPLKEGDNDAWESLMESQDQEGEALTNPIQPFSPLVAPK